MLEDVSLRSINEGDIDLIFKIEKLVFKIPWKRSQFYESMERSKGLLILFRGKPIGYGLFQIVLEEANLLKIAIIPEFQGRGMGFNLLDALILSARNYRVSDCFLEVQKGNTAALKLYIRYGFNEIGIRKDYYITRSGREDALVMGYSLKN